MIDPDLIGDLRLFVKSDYTVIGEEHERYVDFERAGEIVPSLKEINVSLFEYPVEKYLRDFNEEAYARVPALIAHKYCNEKKIHTDVIEADMSNFSSLMKRFGIPDDFSALFGLLNAIRGEVAQMGNIAYYIPIERFAKTLEESSSKIFKYPTSEKAMKALRKGKKFFLPAHDLSSNPDYEDNRPYYSFMFQKFYHPILSWESSIREKITWEPKIRNVMKTFLPRYAVICGSAHVYPVMNIFDGIELRDPLNWIDFRNSLQAEQKKTFDDVEHLFDS